MRHAYCHAGHTGKQSFPGERKVTKMPLLQGMLCNNKTCNKIYIACTITKAQCLNKIAPLLRVHAVIGAVIQKEGFNWILFLRKGTTIRLCIDSCEGLTSSWLLVSGTKPWLWVEKQLQY